MRIISKLKIFVTMFIILLVIIQAMTYLQHRKDNHQEYVAAAGDFYHNLYHANLYMELALENRNDKDLFLKNARYTAMWLKGTRVAFNKLSLEADKQGIQFSLDFHNIFYLINLDTFIEMDDNNQANVKYLNSTYENIHRVYQTLNEQTLLYKSADIQKIIDEF